LIDNKYIINGQTETKRKKYKLNTIWH